MDNRLSGFHKALEAFTVHKVRLFQIFDLETASTVILKQGNLWKPRLGFQKFFGENS